jgi:O-antigen/teichoic acid export membrane protein
VEQVKRKMAKGAAWMISFKLLQRFLSLISVMVLARLLVPEDFGLVALATAFIAALELFTAFNFDVVLIQRQDSTRVHYDTVWTIQVIFGFVLCGVLLSLARPVAAFYEDPRLFNILAMLSVGTLIKGFENVGVVDFRKNLQFDKEFLFMFLPRLAGFCTTIPAAFWFRSYWALIAGILVMNAASTIGSFVLSKYRPRVSLLAFKELFDFSKWLLINNVLQFSRHRASDFIIGKVGGPNSLGTFTVAYEVASIPTTELVAPINRAVLPGYAKMAHSLAEIRQGYLDVIGLIALFAIPAAVGIAGTSELFVLVLLGEKWAAAAPLIAILALAGALGAMETNVTTVYLALGKPYILTVLYAFYVAILIPLVIVMTLRNGALGAAQAFLLTAMVNLPVYYATMFRTLQLGVSRFVATVWRPIVAAGAMYVGVREYVSRLDPAAGSIDALPHLLLAVTIGAVAYAACLAALWLLSDRPAGAETAVIGEFRRRVPFLS